MNRIRVSALVLVGAATLAASCGFVDPMSDTELAECRDAADAVNGATSIGGSSVLISVPAVLLPDVVIPPAATPAEMEAAYDEAYREIYKISVDELLALRADADALTTARLGEPPGIGAPLRRRVVRGARHRVDAAVERTSPRERQGVL